MTKAAKMTKNEQSYPPNATVRFNVGGCRYEVARSTLELYPRTFLARMLDEVWQQEGHRSDDEFFVDRNGRRFQYVLDWMRDGTVNLPVTESVAAVRKELEYYGFEEVKERSVVSGVLDSDMLQGINGNVYDEIDKINASLEELEKEQKKLETSRAIIKASHILFQRCASVEEGGRIAIKVKDSDYRQTINKAAKTEKRFAERLATYGLRLVAAPYMYIGGPVVLERLRQN